MAFQKKLLALSDIETIYNSLDAQGLMHALEVEYSNTLDLFFNRGEIPDNFQGIENIEAYIKEMESLLSNETLEPFFFGAEAFYDQLKNPRLKRILDCRKLIRISLVQIEEDSRYKKSKGFSNVCRQYTIRKYRKWLNNEITDSELNNEINLIYELFFEKSPRFLEMYRPVRMPEDVIIIAYDDSIILTELGLVDPMTAVPIVHAAARLAKKDQISELTINDVIALRGRFNAIFKYIYYCLTYPVDKRDYEDAGEIVDSDEPIVDIYNNIHRYPIVSAIEESGANNVLKGLQRMQQLLLHENLNDPKNPIVNFIFLHLNDLHTRIKKGGTEAAGDFNLDLVTLVSVYPELLNLQFIKNMLPTNQVHNEVKETVVTTQIEVAGKFYDNPAEAIKGLTEEPMLKGSETAERLKKNGNKQPIISSIELMLGVKDEKDLQSKLTNFVNANSFFEINKAKRCSIVYSLKDRMGNIINKVEITLVNLSENKKVEIRLLTKESLLVQLRQES